MSTTVHSMEKAPLNKEESLNKNAISRSASKLDSATANILSFDSREDNYALDLSAMNNSFSLNDGNTSTSSSTIRARNLWGHPAFTLSRNTHANFAIEINTA